MLKPTQTKRYKALNCKHALVLWTTLGLFSSEKVCAYEMVFDATSFARMGEMMGQATKSIEFFGKMTQHLEFANRMMGEGLDPKFMLGLRRQNISAERFGSVLESFNHGGDAVLSKLNYTSSQTTGKDFSQYIHAQNYVKRHFFPEAHEIKTATDIQAIKQRKDDAAEISMTNSLALATQQKHSLKSDHENLTNMSNQAGQNTSLTYQMGVQNRMLERISYQLEKIIAIQAQMLELQATQAAQAKPILFTNSGGEK